MNHNICSIPNDKYDQFLVEMLEAGNVCANVKRDRMREGNVLVTVRSSRGSVCRHCKRPHRILACHAASRAKEALGYKK